MCPSSYTKLIYNRAVYRFFPTLSWMQNLNTSVECLECIDSWNFKNAWLRVCENKCYIVAKIMTKTNIPIYFAKFILTRGFNSAFLLYNLITSPK